MGVKNGINAFGKKNYLGTFAPPFAVINDFDFLPTLLDRDWLSGVSEAIKAALIKDPDFFAHIEHAAPRSWSPRPGRDGGRGPAVGRAPPVAHRDGRRPVRADVLASARFRPLGRPQARAAQPPSAAPRRGRRHRHRPRQHVLVSVGVARREATGGASSTCCCALKLSVSAPELEEALDDPGHPRSVLAGLAEFREHLGGQLTIMLLRSIGDAFDVHEIDTGVMIRSIEDTRAMSTSTADLRSRRPSSSTSTSSRTGTACSSSRRFSTASIGRAAQWPASDFRMQVFREGVAALSGTGAGPPAADSDAPERPDHRAAAGARSQGRRRRVRPLQATARR